MGGRLVRKLGNSASSWADFVALPRPKLEAFLLGKNKIPLLCPLSAASLVRYVGKRAEEQILTVTRSDVRSQEFWHDDVRRKTILARSKETNLKTLAQLAAHQANLFELGASESESDENQDASENTENLVSSSSAATHEAAFIKSATAEADCSPLVLLASASATRDKRGSGGDTGASTMDHLDQLVLTRQMNPAPLAALDPLRPLEVVDRAWVLGASSDSLPRTNDNHPKRISVSAPPEQPPSKENFSEYVIGSGFGGFCAENSGSTGSGWNEERDSKLTKLVRSRGAKDWSRVATAIGMPETSCMERWEKVLKPTLKKGAWSAEEDEVLVSAVKDAGTADKTKWSQVAELLPGRIGKQCRERWLNHLDPIRADREWGVGEDAELHRLHAVHGNKWSLISSHMTAKRTENGVKNRYHSAAFAKYCTSEGLVYTGVPRGKKTGDSSSSSTARTTAIVKRPSASSLGATSSARELAPSSLKSLETSIAAERKYACPASGCEKAYSTAASLSQHKRKKHPELINPRGHNKAPALATIPLLAASLGTMALPQSDLEVAPVAEPMGAEDFLTINTFIGSENSTGPAPSACDANSTCESRSKRARVQ